jgi:hypothetical protein
MTKSLQELASEAAKPRVRCGSKKSCSCSDYPKRMAAFHEAATPQRILQMLAESQDQSTKLEIALDAMTEASWANDLPPEEFANAIETLRGK